MKISLKAFKARFGASENGNIAIPFALMAFVMFGTIGMAIDIGRATRGENQLQNALDAAAIAALKEPTATRGTMATQIYNLNMESFNGTFTQPHFETMGNGAVIATANVSVPTTISQLMQVHSIAFDGMSMADPRVVGSDGSAATTTTTTTTTQTGTSLGPCLHVMDQSGSDALYGDSNSNLHADNCNVYIRTNSSEALYDISSSDVRFRNIKVKGAGVRELQGQFQVLGAPYQIELNQPVVADPYEPSIRSVIQVISNGACTAANTGKTWTGKINPGTYCGATTFSGTTFNPGLYIIMSGNGAANAGALTLTGKLNGSAGVTFYFADNKSTLKAYTASEQSVLTAPATGLTRGLLFFEASNRGATWNLTIASVNKQSWTGLIYFPSCNLTLNSLSEWPKWNLAMEVNRLKMISLSSVWEPFPWTPYNSSSPVTYDAGAFGTTTVTSTTTDPINNPIYLAK